MILILTATDDVHADKVTEYLDALDAPFRRIDLEDYPSKLRLALSYESGEVRGHIQHGSESLVSTDIQSIWYRRPGAPVADPSIADTRIRRYIEAECLNHVDDFLAALPVFQLPAPPARQRLADLKAMQLALACSLGMKTPRTLITNDPGRLLDFHQRRSGSIVSKLASGTLVHHYGLELSRYTQVLRRKDLDNAEAAALCPTIFQQYVEKAFELRITIVGDEIFAVEIHSQDSNRARYDWRHYDLGNTPHRPHRLPRDIADALLLFMRRLDLAYGAIDMIVTPQGEYVFLEINPNGQYLWIERASGLPISRSIARLLASPPQAKSTNDDRARNVEHAHQ